MRPLKDRHEWPPLAVYDIETTSWTNVVLLCHVDELGNRVHFDTVAAYIDWLFSDFGGHHVWAHAGGRFDHRFLIPEFNRRGMDFSAALSGGTIVLLTVTSGGKKLYLADSFRIMPNALKSIGKTVDLPKLDVDRGHIEALSKEERLEYCFRDCDIALKGLQLMRNALNAVNADFAFTLASIASRWVRRSPSVQWKRLYKVEGGTRVYDERYTKADEWCYPAYFGGRTEMFMRGKIKGPVYYYDIVSSYPNSMQCELPLYFQGYFPAPSSLTPTNIKSFLSHSGITEAWVNVPKCKVAPLCVKMDGRLAFPYGHKLGRIVPSPFPANCQCGQKLTSHSCAQCGTKHPTKKWVAGRWTNIELMAALERGAEILPICQARYQSAPFLLPFVSTFYELRRAAKKAKDAFRTYAYKILLNSLYGKLVETIDRTAYVTSESDLERAKANNAKIQMTKIPGVFCVKQQEEGPFRHVAAGAYVTAYSRLNLLRGLESAMSAGGEIYYCDTDSIMTNVKLDHLQGSELGQWQHEHTFSELEIILPKVYRATLDSGEVIYRCKGLPIVREHEPPDIPELRWEAFKRYAETQDPEMAKLLGREGLTGVVADINAGVLSPRTTTLIRCLKSSDRKRDWDGQDSWPLRIGGQGV